MAKRFSGLRKRKYPAQSRCRLTRRFAPLTPPQPWGLRMKHKRWRNGVRYLECTDCIVAFALAPLSPSSIIFFCSALKGPTPASIAA
jgi:hypothetical protein